MARYTTLLAALLLAVALVAASAWAQEDDQDAGAPPSGQEQVNMELIERMVRQLSPECQAEMQAMGQDGEEAPQLSDTCQQEMQQVVAKMRFEQQQAQGGAGAPGQQAVEKRDLAFWEHPLLRIFLFLIAVFSGLGYYLYNVGQSLPAPRAKPLSRKKEEKLRRRGL